VYNISGRQLALTTSPSIDILKSSNVERFLYLLSEGDAQLVERLMNDLATTGKFVVPNEIKIKLKSLFFASYTTEEQTLSTIESTFKNSRVVVDPHTAVALKVARDFRAVDEDALQEIPMVVAATAHWAKFPVAVAAALDRTLASFLTTPSSSVTADDVRRLYDTILRLAPSAHVPHQLRVVTEGHVTPPTPIPASIEHVTGAITAHCASLSVHRSMGVHRHNPVACNPY